MLFVQLKKDIKHKNVATYIKTSKNSIIIHVILLVVLYLSRLKVLNNIPGAYNII